MTTFVYVANADSHDISILALDAQHGTLDEVERFATAGRVQPLAASPDGRVLHAAIRSEPLLVQSLAIDPGSGRLTEIGRAPLPAGMSWLSTDRAGRFLLAASYHSSVVTVAPIGADGAARAVQQVVATEANTHAVQVGPSNRHAFATCLGGGVIRQMRFDASSGHLADGDPLLWVARPGAGPRHFVFHPHAPYVYLVNELDGGVDVLALDTAQGCLALLQTERALPPGFTGAPWAADIHITPDGRFLYASERRSSTLAAFSVDRASGRIAPLGSFATETQPRGFAITPDGRFLFAVGEVSHRLSRYAIDAGSGRLEKLGDQPVGKRPNWVEIVALPD